MCAREVIHFKGEVASPTSKEGTLSSSLWVAAVEVDPNVSVWVWVGVCVGVLVLRRFREVTRERGLKGV